MDTGAMDWVKSPVDGVWRKRLELKGPLESGRVTSLVKFDAGAKFPAHGHAGGEEILVLSGIFSDHTGDYGPGSYLLNTEGFSHEPWSDDGCELFVKLQQYGGDGRQQLALDTAAMDWQEGDIPGLQYKVLSADERFDDRTMLFRLRAGSQVPLHDHPGGEEVYIIEGELEDQHGLARAGCWARYPRGSSHSVGILADSLLYVKSGGLPPEA